MNKMLSNKVTVKKYVIDDKSILVIDNILKDPISLRKFGLDAYSKSVNKTNLLGIGERVESKADGSIIEIYPDDKRLNKKFPHLISELGKIIKEELGAEIAKHYGLAESGEPLKLQKGPYYNAASSVPRYLPHVDAAHISSFIYLNSPAQCWGGTAIYRHVPTGKLFTDQASTSLDWLAEAPLAQPLTTSTSEWKLEHMLEMKFNRLVAFNGSFIHKIYWPDKNCPFRSNIKLRRLTINSFYWYR